MYICDDEFFGCMVVTPRIDPFAGDNLRVVCFIFVMPAFWEVTVICFLDGETLLVVESTLVFFSGFEVGSSLQTLLLAFGEGA